MTVTRVSDHAYLVIGADVLHRRMIAWLERHAEGGPYVTIVDMSSSRTLLTVQGPRSRELLSRLTTADLSNEAFPYLTAQEIDVHHGVALALRVTYLGELGWELHVPTDYAMTVYDSLMDAGRDLGIRDAGLGALNSLRLEKAYRDYALDIFNDDKLIDVGLEFTVAWDKPGGFIGRDALVAQRDEGVRRSRMVQVLVRDREPLLYGDERCTGPACTSVRTVLAPTGTRSAAASDLRWSSPRRTSPTSSWPPGRGSSTSWAPGTRSACRSRLCTTRSASGSRLSLGTQPARTSRP